MTWEHALAEYIRFLSLSVQYYFLEPKQGVLVCLLAPFRCTIV